ncbi:MAG: hypothetical protein WKF75_19335 [Singulisphaera sp.]
MKARAGISGGSWSSRQRTTRSAWTWLFGQKRKVRPGSMPSKGTGPSPGSGGSTRTDDAQGTSRTGTLSASSPAESRNASARATVSTVLLDPTRAIGGGRLGDESAHRLLRHLDAPDVMEREADAPLVPRGLHDHRVSGIIDPTRQAAVQALLDPAAKVDPVGLIGEEDRDLDDARGTPPGRPCRGAGVVERQDVGHEGRQGKPARTE